VRDPVARERPVRDPVARERPVRDPVARRGAVFAVCVLLALVGGYFIGRSSSSSSPTPPPTSAHVHAGGGSYGLVVESPTFAVGVPQPLRFTVRAPDGAVVTRFETVHDKRLHLIVLRTDLTGYQHLHPDLGPDGMWSVALALPAPGSWRIFADFATIAADGHRVDDTAMAQLQVPGSYAPAELPALSPSFVVDGIVVTMEGALRAGGTVPLLVRTSAPALERYLGAFGHLVVVRADDLSYVHVHPEEQLYRGAVRFWVTAPGHGKYRAFFDFSIGGIVRTAEFTLGS
jgi:hypothetical protein